MTANDHVNLLGLHGVCVDVVLHDPSATLTHDPAALARVGMESVARPLWNPTDLAAHDPERLRCILRTLLALHHGEPSAGGGRSSLLAPTACGAVA